MPEATVPYDLTAALAAAPAGQDRAVLVVAACAVTLHRWTAVPDVVIAVAGAEFRLRIDDRAPIAAFLRELRPAGTASGAGHLAVVSPHAELSAGELHFGIDVPFAAHGFAADLGEAVRELAGRAGTLGDVRCLAPHRRPLAAPAGAACRPADIRTLFCEQVRRSPHAIAVRDDDGELTYEQLAAVAEHYAGTLHRAGARAGGTVLVATKRSIGEVVALLATLHLGAAYAGFDEAAPPARAARIVDRLAPSVVVADGTEAGHPALRGLPRAEPWRHGQALGPAAAAAAAADPRRAAYIAFTSGSTGEPKGVVVPQQAVTRLAATAELRLHPGDRVLRMAPLAFDASTFEIWVTLLGGATLEVFPGRLPSVRAVERFLGDRSITVAWLTASLFRLIATTRPQALGGLRRLLSGGEVVSHECAARMLDLYPGLVITNGYGPTENTTFTTTHTVRTSAEIDGPLPIGRPVAGTRVYVLDRNGRLLPPGAVGELYAAGTGLADGYLADEPETGKRFGTFSPDVGERLYRTGDLVRIAPDGTVRFLGRADTQIKLDGHRIEIEEIGAALAGHPGIRDAVVVVARHRDRSPQLVAAVVVRPGAEPDQRQWRAFLADRLPSYALPAAWVVVDEIPLTRNGKIDDRALIDAAMRPAAVSAR